MEAARILASLGVKPKRTIRFALWNAEEQGLLGSLAYIDQHLAARPKETDPEKLKAGDWSGWMRRYPVTAKPGYGELAAYFNLDNGSGKIRGIYTEGNVGVAPIFREWLAPFSGMGAGRGGCQPYRRHRPCLHAIGRPAGVSVHPGPARL